MGAEEDGRHDRHVGQVGSAVEGRVQHVDVAGLHVRVQPDHGADRLLREFDLLIAQPVLLALARNEVRLGDLDFLLLGHGQLAAAGLGADLQADPFEEQTGVVVLVGRPDEAPPRTLPTEEDILPDGEVGDQVEALEYEPDFLIADARALPVVEAAHVLAVQFIHAAAGRFQRCAADGNPEPSRRYTAGRCRDYLGTSVSLMTG